MEHFQRSERVTKRWDGAVLTSHVEGGPTRSSPGHGSHWGGHGGSQGNAFVKVNNPYPPMRATSLVYTIAPSTQATETMPHYNTQILQNDAVQTP